MSIFNSLGLTRFSVAVIAAVVSVAALFYGYERAKRRKALDQEEERKRVRKTSESKSEEKERKRSVSNERKETKAEPKSSSTNAAPAPTALTLEDTVPKSPTQDYKTLQADQLSSSPKSRLAIDSIRVAAELRELKPLDAGEPASQADGSEMKAPEKTDRVGGTKDVENARTPIALLKSDTDKNKTEVPEKTDRVAGTKDVENARTPIALLKSDTDKNKTEPVKSSTMIIPPTPTKDVATAKSVTTPAAPPSEKSKNSSERGVKLVGVTDDMVLNTAKDSRADLNPYDDPTSKDAPDMKTEKSVGEFGSNSDEFECPTAREAPEVPKKECPKSAKIDLDNGTWPNCLPENNSNSGNNSEESECPTAREVTESKKAVTDDSTQKELGTKPKSPNGPRKSPSPNGKKRSAGSRSSSSVNLSGKSSTTSPGNSKRSVPGGRKKKTKKQEKRKQLYKTSSDIEDMKFLAQHIAQHVKSPTITAREIDATSPEPGVITARDDITSESSVKSGKRFQDVPESGVKTANDDFSSLKNQNQKKVEAPPSESEKQRAASSHSEEGALGAKKSQGEVSNKSDTDVRTARAVSSEQKAQASSSSSSVTTAKELPSEKGTDEIFDEAAKGICDTKQKEEIDRIIAMSNCFCRVSHKSLPLPDNQALYDAKLQHRLLPTQIDPIQFEQLKPLDLTKPILDHETTLSDRALGINKEAKAPEQTFLTPFNPVLHALTYADRHATLLETLLTNYNFLE